jgi:hypothetical protein
MPSRDDEEATTKTVRPGLTGNGGEALESIINPGGSSPDDGSSLLDESDMVDSLLTEEDLLGGAAARIVIAPAEEAGDAPVEASPPARAPAGDAVSGDARSREPSSEELPPDDYRRQKASKLRLGDILKEMGLATEEQIESAISRQHETHKRLGQLLVEDGVVTHLDLTKALAQKFGVSFLDLTSTPLEAAASGYIDEKLARR